MTEANLDPLLRPYPAGGYAKLADRLAALLGTRNDVIFVQAEAVVALEALAFSIGSSSIRALNIVTSTYGGWFGEWLRRGGAMVTDLAAAAGRPIELAAVADALQADPSINLVAVVHAESATGIRNPLEDIAALARMRGALLLVDAVASFGGHGLDLDALGIDAAVIGAQKSLGGPAGISAIAVGPRAWAAIDRPDAPRRSVLSLVDIRRAWLETGRGALPGMPSAVEYHLLEAALDRIEAETLEGVLLRHHLAARATRDGVRALGLEPWVPDAEASNLVTALEPPAGVSVAALLAALPPGLADITAASGAMADRLVRLNHTGSNASRAQTEVNLAALGEALASLGVETNPQAALDAIAAVYGSAR